MSDTSSLLLQVTERLLADQLDDSAMRNARTGNWIQVVWDRASDQGLLLALVEGEQGFGVPLDEGLALVRLLGKRAVPLPLAETMAANCLLARAGLTIPSGAVALVPHGGGISLRDGRAIGEADRVAWGRNADALLIQDGDRLGLVTTGFSPTRLGNNVANMPRDRLAVDAPASIAPAPGISVIEMGAIVRALMMAGALQTLVAMTVTHVTERVQFGRPLSAFQAVQHALARLAAEAAAGSAAADLAADAFVNASPRADIAIAAARARLSDAAGTAIGIAHQLHGAIGFTEEHRLHWFTTALWAWRDEFGSAAWWTRRLGEAALGHSKQAYWPFVTSV